MGMGAFGILTFRNGERKLKTYQDLAGYGRAAPFPAFLMTMFMLSMIGLPLTAGFIGKFQIFSAALESGLVWLTIIGVLNSALSVYYYLRVVVFMYMKEGEGDAISAKGNPANGFALTGLVAAAAAIVYLGIFPGSFIELTSLSVRSMF